MKEILFLLPKNSMSQDEYQSYSDEFPDIDFCFSDTNKLSPYTKKKIHSKTKIIAARANTAVLLREWYPELHIIDIRLTGYDILHSINDAHFLNKTIAVVTTNAISIELNIFEDVFHIKILNFLSTPCEDFPKAIDEAIVQGADIIMGGALASEIARKKGFPTMTLRVGRESVMQTLYEIRQVAEAVEKEASRQELTQVVMNHSQEGVLFFENTGCIKSANTSAGKILGQPSIDLLNKNVVDIFPQLKGTNFADFNNTISDSILTNENSEYLYSKLPIKVGDKGYGGILTFQKTEKIQDMEKAIRRQKFTKNHKAKYNFVDIIGTSTKMDQIITIGKNYAKTDYNILVTGETGSGKEVFVQSIHNASKRANAPFVAVNCAALPKNLLESELFGYVEGAFTGATKKGKAGLFEIAHKGTLFLDEISEMDPENQGALLRVMQENYVIRLGSHSIIPVDVRIIAATNKNLRQLIKENKFREDLYYRLNVLPVSLPPIRERTEDIPLLLKEFLYRDTESKHEISFTKSAEKLITKYPWPGNVREIESVAKRILASTIKNQLSDKDIRPLLEFCLWDMPEEIQEELSLTEQLQKEELMLALKKHRGNIEQTAKELHISRSTLWRWKKQYRL